MFTSLRISGREGELVIGHTSAARLGPWTIVVKEPKPDGGAAVAGWRLRTRATRIDRFLVRQAGIGFVAPKGAGLGFWCFPVKSVAVDSAGAITAVLGQPHR